jgi:voltage-gated potassium channel
LIVLTYFTFTSLSTVGLGDFVPKSDTERLIGSFILLFGVAIFSVIMSEFIDILHEFRAYNNEINHN